MYMVHLKWNTQLLKDACWKNTVEGLMFCTLNVAGAFGDIMESSGKETDGRRSRKGHGEEAAEDGGRTKLFVAPRKTLMKLRP